MIFLSKYYERCAAGGTRISLCELLLKYKRVRTADYERRDVRLDDIKHIIHPMYVDNRSRSFNYIPVADAAITMQVVGYNGRDET